MVIYDYITIIGNASTIYITYCPVYFMYLSIRTLRISGVMLFGPLEEKSAMDGARTLPSCEYGGVMYPAGSL